jgi:lipopolysaccharide export system permease protein
MSRIINRYILKEIAVPFGMILFVLTFILLMGKILQLMDLMINKGVQFIDIAQLMLFLIPSLLMFTIPISLLIAILVGMGRLSGDNEITILKMSGVSLYQLSYPLAVAALLAFLLTGLTTIYLVPFGNVATKNLLFEMARQKASIGMKERVFIDDFQGILLYAEKISPNGDYLEGVLVSDNRMGNEPSTIFARKAYPISDPTSLTMTLRMENGSTHTLSSGMKNYRKMDFRFYDIRLDLASSLTQDKADGGKSSTDMTVAELTAGMKKLGVKDEAYRELAIELNKKITIPLSCLVFALIGLPLGIRAHRSVRSRGFVIGFALVLVYYLLRLVGEALVETNRLSPMIGAWTPNVVFATAGILLFYFSAQERIPRFLSVRRGTATRPGGDSGSPPAEPVSPLTAAADEKHSPSAPGDDPASPADPQGEEPGRPA